MKSEIEQHIKDIREGYRVYKELESKLRKAIKEVKVIDEKHLDINYQYKLMDLNFTISYCFPIAHGDYHQIMKSILKRIPDIEYTNSPEISNLVSGIKSPIYKWKVEYKGYNLYIRAFNITGCEIKEIKKEITVYESDCFTKEEKENEG